MAFRNIINKSPARTTIRDIIYPDSSNNFVVIYLIYLIIIILDEFQTVLAITEYTIIIILVLEYEMGQWKINTIFDIVVWVLVLYIRYQSVNTQHKNINTAVYSWKLSRVQRFRKTRGILFLQCFRIVTSRNGHVVWHWSHIGTSHRIYQSHMYNHVRTYCIFNDCMAIKRKWYPSIHIDQCSCKTDEKYSIQKFWR